MKRFKTLLRTHWRGLGIVLGGMILSAGLMLINLGSLTSGLSSREIQLDQQTSSLAQIAHNPVGLPLHLVQWVVGLLPMQSAFWLRLPSVVFVLMALLAIVYVLRRWYGPRTALFGFFLLTTSAWMLHVGRLATDDVLFVWAIAVMLTSNVILHHHAESRATSYIWALCNLSVLYLPGMVWFVLLNTILQRYELLETLRSLKSWLPRMGWIFVMLILVSPLLYGLIVGDTRSVGLALLGAPDTLPSVHTVLANARDAVLFIAVRGQAPNDVWLNHLPILGAFMTVALVAGTLFYGKHWRAGRSKLLATYLLTGLLLVTAGGAVTIGVIVPLLYVIAAAGIAYLLHEWLVVFPRNPLARGFGILLVSVVVAAACLYNLRHYFVAWPHHQETTVAFTAHKIEPSRR